MYAISTSAFVSILALAMSLAVSVQAGNPRPECSRTYDVKDGQFTCDTLSKKFGLSSTDLSDMNTSELGVKLNCDDSLPTSTLCVATTAPACAKTMPAKSTVCSEFLAAHNLTAWQLHEYNDDVAEDCNKTGLAKGQQYCVSVKAH